MKPINILMVLLFPLACFAQTENVRKKQFNLKRGVMLEGYDAVSYFDGAPEEGKEHFRYVFKGTAYHFISQNNLNRFKSNPDKYEPAYGGWCAYAMGETGEKVKV